MNGIFEELYEHMYACMISKDTSALGNLLDENFALVHLTGMRQSKAEFLAAITNGTLNYFSVEHEKITANVTDNLIEIIGSSKVQAAVFGGGKSVWRLRLIVRLISKNGRWLIEKAIASTY